ncbi:hypothetical protein ACFW31_18480 [Nocardiopsis alba]|uniref:hypothetical protein n=1 Tax=Nocardiopsis alba TaxID=53437 RepID=UPI00366BA26A
MPDDTDTSDDLMLVPLWETKSGHQTRYGDEVDLRADRLDATMVSALRDAALTLAPDEEIDPDALQGLRNRLTVPDSFEKSGWLSEHHVLLMRDDDTATVGSFTFAFHPVFGLEVVDPQVV